MREEYSIGDEKHQRKEGRPEEKFRKDNGQENME